MENGGKIELELYPEHAPLTVANFEALVKAGFYNGLTFHRVIPGFMIQGGDPLGNGMGGSDKKIKGEFRANGHNNPIKHERGVISMARADYTSYSPELTEDMKECLIAVYHLKQKLLEEQVNNCKKLYVGMCRKEQKKRS